MENISIIFYLSILEPQNQVNEHMVEHVTKNSLNKWWINMNQQPFPIHSPNLMHHVQTDF